MTPEQMTRLRDLAEEPMLPIQSDRYLLLQAELDLRVMRGQLERLALCPDHRDKAIGGRCVVCVGEERGARGDGYQLEPYADMRVNGQLVHGSLDGLLDEVERGHYTLQSNGDADLILRMATSIRRLRTALAGARRKPLTMDAGGRL